MISFKVTNNFVSNYTFEHFPAKDVKQVTCNVIPKHIFVAFLKIGVTFTDF